MTFNFKYKQPNVVAEIGCNHMGSMEKAIELIDLAKNAGVKYVKFQKRSNKELLTDDQYNSPHPNPKNSYGKTYGEHREFLEFNLDQVKTLKEYCEKTGLVFTTSVWDVTSTRQIISLEPEFIKVPSATNNNYEILKLLRDEYLGNVQISTGMTSKNEIEDIVLFFEETKQAQSRLLLYSCTSGYPVPPKDVTLLEIKYLYDNYGKRVNEIGFSGHHLGIALDMSAYTLGSRWIERHFTKDKSWKGTDHCASLDFDEMKNLVLSLDEVYSALNYKQPEILPIEKDQRAKLKNRK